MLHLERLKDVECAHDYTITISNMFYVLSTNEDPVELWDTFKREAVKMQRRASESARDLGVVMSREKNWRTSMSPSSKPVFLGIGTEIRFCRVGLEVS